jgi:hypothetical protein
MKLKITLSGSGGELDSQIVTVPEGAADEAASNMLKDIINEWRLDAGDTIKIEEV